MSQLIHCALLGLGLCFAEKYIFNLSGTWEIYRINNFGLIFFPWLFFSEFISRELLHSTNETNLNWKKIFKKWENTKKKKS